MTKLSDATIISSMKKIIKLAKKIMPEGNFASADAAVKQMEEKAITKRMPAVKSKRAKK